MNTTPKPTAENCKHKFFQELDQITGRRVTASTCAICGYPYLLPCPFCGGKAKFDIEEGGVAILCTNENCAARDVYCTQEQWNTRPASPDEMRIRHPARGRNGFNG